MRIYICTLYIVANGMDFVLLAVLNNTAAVLLLLPASMECV